ncbi:fibronectin type III domain-containing protein [Cellulomonas sp. URHB0016]
MSTLPGRSRRGRSGALAVALALGGLVLAPMVPASAAAPGPSGAPTTVASPSSQQLVDAGSAPAATPAGSPTDAGPEQPAPPGSPTASATASPTGSPAGVATPAPTQPPVVGTTTAVPGATGTNAAVPGTPAQQRSAAPDAAEATAAQAPVPQALAAQAASTPYPPADVTVSQIGVDRFTIGWTAPVGGATATAYRVYVWENRWQGTPALDVTVDAGTRSVVATGLKPGTAYTAEVVTVAGADLSAASAASVTTVLTDHRPVGYLDSVTVIPGGGGVRVVGWALDVDTAGPLEVELRIDGSIVPADVLVANRDRPDVGAAYPGSGNLHGIDYAWSSATPTRITPGAHQVCLWAREPNEPPEVGTTNVGCQSVTIKPVRPVVGNFEVLARSGSDITVRGWSLEPSGGEDVEVIVEVDDDLDTDTVTSYLHTDAARPDVAAAYPGTGTQHGFTVTLPSDPGEHVVCVWALLPFLYQPERETPLGCRTLGVDPTIPVGNLESLASTVRGLSFSGWALDPQVSGPVDVDVYLDDVWASTVRTTTARADVERAYPGTGTLHGYSGSVPAMSGTHEVCLYTSDPTYDVDVPVGCRTVTVAPPPNRMPLANFESLTSMGSTVTLSGWALDPDVNGPIDVHFYVNGGWGGAMSTTGVRTDVGRAYPGTGDLHGFSRSFTAGPGTHQICAYAIDTTTRTGTPMGCRTVTVGNKLPLGNFESLTATGSTVTLSGWALDPDVNGPVDVHFYVNGRWGGAMSTTGVRTDVGRAYPGTGDLHGFARSFTAGPGTHEVCTYAIDTATGANTPTGCRTVTVH